MLPLAPLVLAYQDKGYSVEPITAENVPDLDQLQQLAANSDAMLLIGSARRSPQSVLSGPMLTTHGGRSVPVGWLPLVSEEGLARFAANAAKIHRRQEGHQPIAVLSQWQGQYLCLAQRIETLLSQQNTTYRWSSDLLYREDMVKGIRSGLAAAIYVGHGRPIGWVGYRGTRAHHFKGLDGEPTGALFSLCCRTASRRRTGLSFAEELPLLGIAGATLGSVNDTLHKNNTRWAVGICAALEAGVSNLAELILKAFPTEISATKDYRIMGDPLIPLVGADGSIEAANAIPIYP